MEIDERNVTWHEDAPFAQGSFGAVYRVTYERRIVAAKMVSLKDVPQNALEATKKEYKREVALMGEVRGGEEIRVGGRGSSERERERERERVQRGCRLHAQRAYGPREGGSEFQKLRTFAFW